MPTQTRNGFTTVSRKDGAPRLPSLDVSSPAASPRIPMALQTLLPPTVIDAVLKACAAVDARCLLEEIRLRADRRASLTVGGRNLMLDLTLNATELFSILTRMCGGSLYAYSQNISRGYVTLDGGIRVGVAGEATCEDGRVVGVGEISALCIRIPHVHGNVGSEVAELLKRMRKNCGEPRGILLYAPPGEGKTTLLRGVAACLAGGRDPWRTVVVDTRGELTFPVGGESLCLDVLTGYPRELGVSIATRSLNAQVIVCDEIGDGREAVSLISAYHGGVPLVATAHGSTWQELMRRRGIRMLHTAGIFGAYVRLRRDGMGGFLYEITERSEVDAVI